MCYEAREEILSTSNDFCVIKVLLSKAGSEPGNAGFVTSLVKHLVTPVPLLSLKKAITIFL